MFPSCVGVCVCVCVCIYIYIYIHIDMYMYVYIYRCVHACLWAVEKKVITALPMLRDGVVASDGSIVLHAMTLTCKHGSKRLPDNEPDPFDKTKYARRGGGLGLH